MSGEIPDYIEEVLGAKVVFGKCQIAEVTTINPKGEPEAFPVYTTYDTERRKIIFDTSIAFTRKIRNIQGNPRVCVLFSNMVVDSLKKFPIILVQGKAQTYDPDPSILTYINQQSEEKRRKFDWYIIRVRVEVNIERIYVWKNRDLDEEPEIITVEPHD
jgi:general stress protein 26